MKRIVVACFAALLLSLLSPTTPSQAARCHTARHTWVTTFGPAGTAFEALATVRWCRVNGRIIKNIDGSIHTSAYGPWETRNEQGPVGKHHAPLPKRMRSGAKVYFFWRHRACAATPFVPTCTNWQWSRRWMQLYANGTMVWQGQYKDKCDTSGGGGCTWWRTVRRPR